MEKRNAKFRTGDASVLNYYETGEDRGKEKPKLLLLHAQGTDASSFENVIPALSKSYHIYAVDYYGHGCSSHIPEKYSLTETGDDIIAFIEKVICDDVTVLGHSSGGLIAAYAATGCKKCCRLILEDPPFFSSTGERRYNTYNYKDLSSVCHSFLQQNEEQDFVYYYFRNQYCWNFFPEKSREKTREKLSGFAKKYREDHPDKNLKVPFWPSKFLEGFRGMQNYDPHFGEAFYDDSFNRGIDYEELLSDIKCPALFMKANTTIGEDGLLQGALSDEDLKRVNELIADMEIRYFDCGHGIHTEKKKEFIKAIAEI